MSRQIALAQTEKDEAEFADALNARANLFAIPRLQQSREFCPVRFGTCDASRQLILLEEDIDALAAGFFKVSEAQGLFTVGSWISNGRTLEWERTATRNHTDKLAGRLYCPNPHHGSNVSVRRIGAVMTHAMRFIRSTYAGRSTDVRKVHVGPHLLKAINEDALRLVHPNGSLVDVVIESSESPKAKKPASRLKQ